MAILYIFVFMKECFCLFIYLPDSRMMVVSIKCMKPAVHVG